MKIRLIETTTGIPTEFDGKWLVEYDPTILLPDGSYDGGLLEVTDDPAQAKDFPTTEECLACWNQSYGIRPDGKPNRPLTAWTVEVVCEKWWI